MIKKYLIILFVCASIPSIAQMKKGHARVDYIDLGDSNGVGFEKYTIGIALPIALKTKGDLLINELLYSRTNIDYATDLDLNGNISTFHSIMYSLVYNHSLKNDWSLTAMLSPSISSNFSSLNWDDLRFFGMVMFSKNLKSNMKLNFGMSYSSILGKSFPLPMFNMVWKPDQKWTLNLGFPRMDVQYQVAKNTIFGTDLFMVGDNFTLGGDVLNQIDNIRVMNLGGGIQVTQKLSKYLKLNMSSGYLFYRKFEFLDGSDSVMEYDLDNNLYIKAGISIGI